MTQWISYIKENEDEALGVIYKKYRPTLIPYFSRQFNVSQEDAIELFQVSVVLLYDQVISGKTKEIRNIKNYLISIAKYNLIKNRKYDERIGGLDWSLMASEDLEENDERNLDIVKLERLLNELGNPCSTLLELFYYRKLSYSEIVDKMGYHTVDAAKTAKYKCLRRLKKMFLIDTTLS
ncbi:RNA polymerase sigma factor [Membranihabitans marinus]|uniref:RNA polymerase sigma factor n=1 Tax=Membranihabitans marinus TaxID=1227546 RepID=UPI001F1EAF1B|nr:sigma-70 family RNA polymerase sigma factor [Membranihabitans marinus]